MLPCSNLSSTGPQIAKFTLGLQITRGKGKLLPGTPLRFTLRKECNLNRGKMMKTSTLDLSSSSPAFQGSVLSSLKRILTLNYYFYKCFYATNLLLLYLLFKYLI